MFLKLGIQFLGLGYYYPSTEKIRQVDLVWWVGYIITRFSSKSYVKSWGVRPNFGEVRTPRPPTWLRPCMWPKKSARRDAACIRRCNAVIGQDDISELMWIDAKPWVSYSINILPTASHVVVNRCSAAHAPSPWIRHNVISCHDNSTWRSTKLDTSRKSDKTHEMTLQSVVMLMRNQLSEKTACSAKL